MVRYYKSFYDKDETETERKCSALKITSWYFCASKKNPTNYF